MEMQEALLNLKDLESIYYIDMVMVIDATRMLWGWIKSAGTS